jgi:hypothetical protein
MVHFTHQLVTGHRCTARYPCVRALSQKQTRVTAIVLVRLICQILTYTATAFLSMLGMFV